MRTKTVLRYYCDHCSKGGFRKPDMAAHEATCTKNPKRGCYLCGTPTGTFDFVSLAEEMKKRDDVYQCDEPHEDTFEVKKSEAIGWLSSEVGGCPACILSVLRQGNIFAFNVFNYKDALLEWHKERAVENHGSLSMTLP